MAPRLGIAAHTPRRYSSPAGGRARIAGHRVGVLDIVAWHGPQGMTLDDIVSHVPSLTLADVHAALACYFDHIAEIQEEMRTERQRVEEFLLSPDGMAGRVGFP